MNNISKFHKVTNNNKIDTEDQSAESALLASKLSQEVEDEFDTNAMVIFKKEGFNILESKQRLLWWTFREKALTSTSNQL